MALCSTACSVELAQEREAIEALPNGSENLSIYLDSDIETYRDVLYYVGQVLGGFFIINREGKLELRKYTAESVLTVEQKHRFSSSFSDYITRYTAVSSTNMRTQIAEYEKVSPLVTQLSWTNHLKIMSACKSMDERIFYMNVDNMDITIRNVLWDNSFLVVFEKEYLPLVTAM